MASGGAAVATAAKTEITLKGSVDIVTEFFGYSINRCVARWRATSGAPPSPVWPTATSQPTPCSILYQRAIYPPESFTPVAKYGLSVLVTTDEGLKAYLANVLRQLSSTCRCVSTRCAHSRRRASRTPRPAHPVQRG